MPTVSKLRVPVAATAVVIQAAIVSSRGPPMNSCAEQGLLSGSLVELADPLSLWCIAVSGLSRLALK